MVSWLVCLGSCIGVRSIPKQVLQQKVFISRGKALQLCMLTRRWVHVCTGVLSVVRSNVAQEKPYTGLTEIKTGEVGT